MNEFDYIRENAERIIYEVGEAKAKYRKADDIIDIMAVTKTVPCEAVNVAVQSGITLLGENRVQEYLSKKDFYDKSASVDFIGHLQTNKVKYIIDSVNRIHSVDNMKLAKEINRLSGIREKTTDILIEVNIGREKSKSGVDPDNLLDFCYELSELPNIRVSGLMSIPPKECSEKFFCKMQELFIDIKAKNIDNSSVWVLSMGMSSDFPVAIKYGSNVVRIGTALFGSRK